MGPLVQSLKLHSLPQYFSSRAPNDKTIDSRCFIVLSKGTTITEIVNNQTTLYEQALGDHGKVKFLFKSGRNLQLKEGQPSAASILVLYLGDSVPIL